MKHLRLVIGLVVIVGLAWLLFAVSPGPAPNLVAERRIPPGRSPEVVQRGEQVDTWIATALDRPLFSPNRRPAVQTPSATAAEAPPPPPPPPRLTAVLVGPFGKEAVFVFSNGAGKAMSVHEGGQAGPYQIRRIMPGAVVVDGPKGELTLHPVFGKQPASDGQQSAPSQRATMTRPGRLPAGT